MWDGLLQNLTFSDDWGVLTRSNSDGTTLDFSAVTGELTFVADGDVVTVAYADPNRTDLLTYSANGKSYSILGSRGNDQFLVFDDSRLMSIDGKAGDDTVQFDRTVGLAGNSTTTTATRNDASTFTLSGTESFTGRVSLGPAIRGEIDEALHKWAGVATEFVQSELLSARIPFLDLSLVEGLGQGFAQTVPNTLDAAKTYATDLLTVNTGLLNGLTDLGALASGIQTQFNSIAPGNPFQVTAGIYDRSELRLEISFDASQSFEYAPSLSSEVTAALASAGIELSAFSNLNIHARLGGSVQAGIRLDGLTSIVDAPSFAGQGFVRVNPLTFEMDANVTDLSAKAGLAARVFGSAATVSVTGGTASLQAQAVLSLDPNLTDGSGRINLAQISATPSIHLQASGSLYARLPLNATLGSFNLSNFGTPTLILATDSLFVYQDDALLVTTPAVSLDVAVNEPLAAKLLDLIGSVRDLGEKLPFGLFDTKIPGLEQSLNQLLTNSESTVEAGGLGSTFQLKDAAGRYFYSNYNSVAGTGTSLNIGVTVRGLLESLNSALASLTQVKFSLNTLDWSGRNLAEFDFSAFRTTGGSSSLSLDFLRGLNFTGADLRGADFSGLDLTGIDFSGARFDGTTKFSGAVLRRAIFSGADLRGVTLSGLDLRWGSFSGARIDGVDFQFAAAFDVNWSNVRFSTGNLPRIGNLISNIDLPSLFGNPETSGWKRLSFRLDLSGFTVKNWSRFDLSGLDFSGVNLTGFNLSGANLRGVSFHGSTLSSVNFSGAFAWDVKWGTLKASTNVNIDKMVSTLTLPTWGSNTGTSTNWASNLNLSGFDFSGWDLSGLDFTGITITGANFSGTLLDGVKLPAFDASLNFSFADFRGINLSGITALSGTFRGVNFSGLNFSNLSFDSRSLDFTGVDFSGSLNLGGLFSGLSNDVRRVFDGVSFNGVNFSGLAAGIKSQFRFGSFQGINFAGANLSGLDFSGVDLSFGWFDGAELEGAKLDNATLLGANLAKAAGSIASAARAFFDALSALPTSWTSNETFMAGLNKVVIEDIFATGAPGPAFAFSGGVKFNGNQVDLSLNLQANIDRSFVAEFALSGDDLPPAVAAVLPTMELSGTAYGRGVLALDFDLGVLLGLRDQSVGGLFTVPVPAASSLDPYFRLNRFDVGASLGVSGLQASLTVAGLGSVVVEDVYLSVMAGGRVALTDSDGDGKLSLSEVAALRTSDPDNWY